MPKTIVPKPFPIHHLAKHWTPGHWSVLDIVDEIETYSPRVTIEVGIALIDDCLTDALSAISAVQEKKFIDRCWDSMGSIRDFSQKVDFGVCFGIYGTMTYADLVKLRDMRNQAAHRTVMRTFGSAIIKGICRDLQLPDWKSKVSAIDSITNPRDRFIATVALITDFLMVWTKSVRAHPPAGSSGATARSRPAPADGRRPGRCGG